MSAVERPEPVPIDLGLVSESAAPGDPLRGPDGHFPASTCLPPPLDLPRPPLWNPSRRRAALVAVIVAAASVSGGSSVGGARQAASVPAPIPPPVTVAAAGDPLAVIGDSLYTRTVADSGRLTAYSLRTGRRRWSVATPASGQLSLVDAGSRLLLTWSPPVGGDPSRARPDLIWTAAIEASTGAMRWRHTGDPLWVAPRGDRVALRNVAPPTGSDSAANPAGTARPDRTVITVLDVATGAPAASYGPVPPGRWMSPVTSPDTARGWLSGVFVREDPNGGQLFDFAGARARRFDLPLAAPPSSMAVGDGSAYEAVLTIGDMILATTGWGGRAVLTGYRDQPPHARWTSPDLSLYDAWRCGTAVCASAVDTSFALDPGTGGIRWSAPGGLLWRASAGRLYSSVLVYSAGRIDRSRGTGLGVLDADTGRELLRHDEWRPVTLVDGARLPILSYSRGGEVLSVLDAGSLATERLAVLPLNRSDCVADAAYVACRAGEHTIRAWRYSF